MRVRRLEVVDFRSYEHASLDLDAGPVALVGLNGQGKTNLAEAIGYCASLDSHRAASDAPLVRVGAERAVVRVLAVVAGRDVRIEVEVNPGRANRVRLNGSPLPRTRDVLGVLRCVTFSPEDLHLVKGDPAERRRFLDGVMVQAAPRYAGVRADFERAVKQRNALLRSGAAWSAADFEASLRAWDDRYLPLAAELAWGRLNAVRRLADPIAAAYRSISPAADEVGVEYESTTGLQRCDTRAELAEVLAAALRSRRSEEMRRGLTLVGPHRDDVSIMLNGMPAKSHASHGESWSLALALRLACFHVLAEIGDEPPVLILDDVFAELDLARRSRLLAAALLAEQTIVTAAVAQDVPADLGGQRWSVLRNGWSRVEPYGADPAGEAP